MTKLPEILSEAVRTADGELELIDPVTQKKYVLVEDDIHAQAMRALQQQRDLEAIRKGVEAADSGELMSPTEVAARIERQFSY